LRIFIIGFGDIGRRVALLERKNGNEVTALARNPQEMEGISTLRADLDHPATLRDLPGGNRLIYYFAPPPAEGTVDRRMQNWLDSLSPGDPPRKIIYISTTGVYGDQRGGRVDEATPPAPRTARAKRRLDAERRLQRWSGERDVPLVILRVGGIYSRERLPIEGIRRRRPVLRRPRCPEITREEAENRLSPAMLSYLDESRRVDNGKMLRELGITLRHPDLRHGLAETCSSRRGTP